MAKRLSSLDLWHLPSSHRDWSAYGASDAQIKDGFGNGLNADFDTFANPPMTGDGLGNGYFFGDGDGGGDGAGCGALHFAFPSIEIKADGRGYPGQYSGLAPHISGDGTGRKYPL